MDDEQAREALRRYGYDPDDPVRGLEIPDRLIDKLAKTPLVPERRVDALKTYRQARDYVRVRDERVRRWLEKRQAPTDPT